jgi:hypothetical protein
MDGLELQIQSLQASKDALVADLLTIQELIREADAELERLAGLRYQSTDSPESSASLKGYRVGVIGPSGREADYREVIESLGASFHFAPSEDKLSQIDRLCSKADGVIFVTSFCSHKVEDHLSAAIRRLGVPVYHLRFKGLKQLREAAMSLLPRMQVYRSLDLASG